MGKLREDSWAAMRAALVQVREHRDQPLYEAVLAQGLKFQYPPSSLLALDLMDVLFGWGAVQNVPLNLMSILFLLGMTVTIWRIYTAGFATGTVRDGQFTAVEHALPILFTMTCYPVLKALELGQIQTWQNALLALAVLLHCRRSSLAAGIVLGLICVNKPQLVLLLPWALLRKEWQIAKGMAFTVAVTQGIALLRYGLDTHLEYVRLLSMVSRHGESYAANQSFNGLLLRLLHLGSNLTFSGEFAPYHPLVHYGTLLTSLLLMALAFAVRMPREPHFRALGLGFAALCFTMAAPIAWEHHYGLVPIVMAVLLPLLWRSVLVARGTWIALGISWLLVAAHLSVTNRLADTRLNFLQCHVYFGGLLLAYVIYRFGRASTAEATTAAVPTADGSTRVARIAKLRVAGARPNE